MAVERVIDPAVERDRPDESSSEPRSGIRPSGFSKILVLLGFGLVVVAFYLIYNQYLSLEKVVAAEATIRGWYANQPVLFVLIAFVIYVVATGLSLPISTALSLSYAWILGWAAVPLLNLAATCGATLAFLSARFFLHDWVQDKFAKYLQSINQGFERDGAFYVVSLRMIAVFPFFVVNLALGLVPIRVRTYFLATMLGMLPLNFAFVYLGMQIPSTEELLEDGLRSLISWQLLLAIGLIGLIPLSLRKIIHRFQPAPSDVSNQSEIQLNDESR